VGDAIGQGEGHAGVIGPFLGFKLNAPPPIMSLTVQMFQEI
jgi:hypothetical protein